MAVYDPDAQIRSRQNTNKIQMQDQVASTRALQKFALRLTKAKELSQVTLVLNVELINLFVHQHQPEIAFKSLMECQEIIDSQKTNNDQQ